MANLPTSASTICKEMKPTSLDLIPSANTRAMHSWAIRSITPCPKMDNFEMNTCVPGCQGKKKSIQSIENSNSDALKNI